MSHQHFLKRFQTQIKTPPPLITPPCLVNLEKGAFVRGALRKLVANCAPSCANLPVFRFVHPRKGAQNCRRFVVNLKVNFGQFYANIPFPMPPSPCNSRPDAIFSGCFVFVFVLFCSSFSLVLGLKLFGCEWKTVPQSTKSRKFQSDAEQRKSDSGGRPQSKRK